MELRIHPAGIETTAIHQTVAAEYLTALAATGLTVDTDR